ncbi:MAG TPA: glycoside hydrolase family 2 TIM barrel-domain containing protein [Terriglobales bacterium]|nr:glycoside hydrolase family 2 TIM barrel-domain containing protein [Terriglobales bacterium]
MSEQSSEITRREFLQIAGAAAVAAGTTSAAYAITGGSGLEEKSVASPLSKKTYDLGQSEWELCGLTPFLWKIDKLTDISNANDAEVGPIHAPVPGSVQQALLEAHVIDDWNVALNARGAEWVENRDWVYQMSIPDQWLQKGKQAWLRCAGLDYVGEILLNGICVLPFKGSFTPYEIDLKPFLKPTGNLLQIWFQPPPRWMGEFGYTSQIKEWKTRFNYYWDWTSRLVQIGIWDKITLEIVDGGEILSARCVPQVKLESGQGSLRLSTQTTGGNYLRVRLMDGSGVLRDQTLHVKKEKTELSWDELPVELWWPNGMGRQRLYSVQIQLLDEQKMPLDSREFRIGFRHIEWKHTQGAPSHAQPYLCVVNGKPVFLFGVNWTPIRPNFADLREEDYSNRVGVYQDIGMNVLRVWGGAFLEKQWFYDLCDEKGLLVWQEFPLCSSGLDNCPPDDEDSIQQLSSFAKSYIERIQHHACLFLWGGGNELEENRAGHVSAQPTLTIARHPMIVKLGDVVKTEDTEHAYVPTAPYGPAGTFTTDSVGKHSHWDVHGPYKVDGRVDGAWSDLWKLDDAMFHSETGCPSTSSAELIRRFKGDLKAVPGTHSNPLWNRQPWWVDWPTFIQETGHEPASLEEFVDWSQKRQSDALAIALSTAKGRFPACGGIILWMGHDGFPCTANLSIIDFDGKPKPAALRLKEILRRG